MAKYGDYAKTDEIDAEISEASENQQARDEKGRFIPDRFKDKDITDVIKSYEELEKLNSRQAQDLGQMRKQVDQLVASQQEPSPAQEPSKPVSVDDLYEDADAVLRRVVREETSGEVTKLHEELQRFQLERKLAELETKYPDWRTKVQDPEFTQWATESPYRQRIVQDADKGDFDAAEEVLGMYYDTLNDNSQEESTKQDQTANLRNAMLESSSPAPAGTVETYSRTDLMDARVAAKHGDTKAERWLRQHADAIAVAYEEGRIVD